MMNCIISTQEEKILFIISDCNVKIVVCFLYVATIPANCEYINGLFAPRRKIEKISLKTYKKLISRRLRKERIPHRFIIFLTKSITTNDFKVVFIVQFALEFICSNLLIFHYNIIIISQKKLSKTKNRFEKYKEEN